MVKRGKINHALTVKAYQLSKYDMLVVNQVGNASLYAHDLLTCIPYYRCPSSLLATLYAQRCFVVLLSQEGYDDMETLTGIVRVISLEIMYIYIYLSHSHLHLHQ